MARKVESITEAQWALIAPLLPEPKASARRGRKSIGNRPCFEGMLVGVAQRREVEGFAGTVSLAEHVLASPARLGRRRSVAGGLAEVARPVG